MRLNHPYAISGFVADFLRLIDVNAGGFRPKKGQGIAHPIKVFTTQQRIVSYYAIVSLLRLPLF